LAPPLYPMCRTVSMSCWVGYNCQPSGVLTGNYGNGAPTPDYTTGEAVLYEVFGKLADMRGAAAPANIFVFIEERAESIDDGSFETMETSTTFPNLPMDYHANAATLGFGDGHVEVHKWHNGSLITPQQPIVHTKMNGSAVNPGRGDQDWYWLSQHASQHR